MPSESYVAPHFGTDEAQEHAAQLGMWIFIATEVLLFGGLFTCYVVYRFLYPSQFIEMASHEMEVTIGTVNTFLLLGSSVLVAMADSLIHRNRRLATAACLFVATCIGITFLCLKGLEYYHHFEHGALPGRWYHYTALPHPGASMFMTLYFLMTGLHAIHMSVAVCVLSVIGWNAAAGRYSSVYSTPVQLGGMYWHLVDIIWVFLWPLFYLLAR